MYYGSFAHQVQLKINSNKSLICQVSVKYVGHMLTHNGIMPDPERVQAIIDIPTPTDKAGVHKFIVNMSDIAKPLYVLLGKDIGIGNLSRAKHFRNPKTN